MIKKLYSQIDVGNEDDYMYDPPSKEGSVGSALLTYNLQSRSFFSLKYWTYRRNKDFNSKWCCCCRSTPSNKNKLFEEAEKKLINELDVLVLLKELRICRFIAQN